MTDHAGSTCVPHYPHTKFDENQSLHSHLRVKVYLLMLTKFDENRSLHSHLRAKVYLLMMTRSYIGTYRVSKNVLYRVSEKY